MELETILQSRDHILQAVIVGTKGTLKLPQFWTAVGLVHSDGTVEEFPLPAGSKHPFNCINSANFAHEVANVTCMSCHVPRVQAEHVRRCLERGATESSLVPLEESLTIARILETARRQIGVVYPQDQD